MIEFTFVMIKPNIMNKEKEERNQIIKNILSRYVEAGLDITLKEETTLTLKQAREHYKEHEGKDFYDDLTHFMADKVTKMVVYGENAIEKVRTINGPTNVEKARKEAPNSLRALYGDIKFAPANAVHASDSKESAEREINYFYEGIHFKQPTEKAMQKRIK